MNSVRTFPRTTNEAFRNTPEHACAIERPARKHKAVNWALFLGAVAVALSLIFQGASK